MLVIVAIGIRVNMMRSKMLMNAHWVLAAAFVCSSRFDVAVDNVSWERIKQNFTGGIN